LIICLYKCAMEFVSFLFHMYHICPLFYFAYYCKTVFVNFGGAVNDKFDELRGLVRFSPLLFRLTKKNQYTSTSSSVWYTHLSFCTYLILPFIPPKNVFVYCIIIEYLYSVHFSFFLYMRNSRVILFRCHHYLFIAPFSS